MRRLPKIALTTGIILMVLVALVLSGLRLALPHINSWRNTLLEQIANASGIPVDASQLHAAWHNSGPVLEAQDLSVSLKDGGSLSVKRVRLAINIWQSLLHWRWQFQDLIFYQLDWHSNTPLNSLTSPSSGDQHDRPPFTDRLFHQFTYFHLYDSQLSVPAANGKRLNLHINNLRWLNQPQRYRAEGQISLSDLNGQQGHIQLRMDLRDHGTAGNGTLWLSADNIDITPWLTDGYQTSEIKHTALATGPHTAARHKVPGIQPAVDQTDKNSPAITTASTTHIAPPAITPEQPPLTSVHNTLAQSGFTSKITLQAWLQIRQGRFSSAQIWLNDGQANWHDAHRPHQLHLHNIQLTLNRLAHHEHPATGAKPQANTPTAQRNSPVSADLPLNGLLLARDPALASRWQLAIPRLHITLDNVSWPVSAFTAAWQNEADGSPAWWRIRVNQVNIGQLNALIPLLQPAIPQPRSPAIPQPPARQNAFSQPDRELPGDRQAIPGNATPGKIIPNKAISNKIISNKTGTNTHSVARQPFSGQAISRYIPLPAQPADHHRPAPPLQPPLLTSPLQQALTLWQHLQPQGKLDLLALDIVPGQPEHSRILARWQQASWQPWQHLPGVENLTGTVAGSLTQGAISASMQQAHFTVPGMFIHPLIIHQANATLHWQHNDNGFTLSGKHIDISAQSLRINGDFHYQQLRDGQPWLSALAGIRLDDVRDLWRYYPRHHLHPQLIHYLNNALLAGQSHDASLIFNGNPHIFPFWNNEGVIEIQLPLRHARFQFNPHWPPIDELALQLHFINDGLFMHTDALTLGGLQLRNVQADIPHYHQEHLLINGELHGNAELLPGYFAQTPLQHSLGQTLNKLQLSGELNASLQLNIPLDHRPAQTRGTVRLHDNDLYIQPLDTRFNKLTGEFQFENKQLQGNGLQARWHSMPVSLGFSSQQQARYWKIAVNLAGNWQPGQLALLPASWRRQLQGNVHWQSAISLNLPDTPDTASPADDSRPQNPSLTHYHITLSADLKHLASQLPVPLNKTPATPLLLQLNTSGDLQQFILTGQLGEHSYLNSRWRLQPQRQPSLQLDRAVFSSDSGQPHKPDLPASASLDIRLPALDGNLLFALLQPDNGNDASKILPAGLPIQLHTPQLNFAGQQWRQFSLRLHSLADGHLLQLHADQLDASLLSQPHHPWQANIHYLDYHPDALPSLFNSATADRATESNTENTSPARKAAPSPVDFSRWPDFQLHCQQCLLWGKNYGRIDADVHIHNQTLTISNGLIDNGHARLTLNGDWQNTPGQPQTRISGSLQGQKFDQLGQFLDMDTPLQGAPYHIRYQLNWHNPPWQPDNTTLNGELQARLKKGKISHISTGKTGKLLRLFSIEALLRQLRFDFRDQFSDGFYFDSITSDARIENGILHTDNTLIKGLSADIAIQGAVNLSANQLDLNAVVAPEISSTVGVATAFVVNPVVGAAVYAASKVLSPLWSKISLLRYHISGSLDNPRINEVLRKPAPPLPHPQPDGRTSTDQKPREQKTQRTN